MCPLVCAAEGVEAFHPSLAWVGRSAIPPTCCLIITSAVITGHFTNCVWTCFGCSCSPKKTSFLRYLDLGSDDFFFLWNQQAAVEPTNANKANSGINCVPRIRQWTTDFIFLNYEQISLMNIELWRVFLFLRVNWSLQCSTAVCFISLENGPKDSLEQRKRAYCSCVWDWKHQTMENKEGVVCHLPGDFYRSCDLPCCLFHFFFCQKENKMGKHLVTI